MYPTNTCITDPGDIGWDRDNALPPVGGTDDGKLTGEGQGGISPCRPDGNGDPVPCRPDTCTPTCTPSACGPYSCNPYS